MGVHRSSGRSRLGLGLALTTALLWGLLSIALKVVLSVLDALTITWFRFLLAFCLLGLFLGMRGELPRPKQILASPWLLGVAIAGLAANYILYLVGLDLTSPNNAQVLIQLAPVLLGLGSLAIFRERYTPVQWAGLGVLVAGMVLFSQDWGDVRASWLGNGALVLAAMTWAGYALAQKQLLQHMSSAQIVLCIYGGAALGFAPFAHPASLLALAPFHAFLLGFCALNTLIAYGAFAEALEHWEASKVSAVLTLTPLVTLAGVWLLSVLRPDLPGAIPVGALGLVGALGVVGGSMAISLGGRGSP